MVSIALVSAEASGSNCNANTTAMLTAKGHTVTFFDEDAVTSSNLSAFGLIFLNRVGEGKTTLAGYLTDYMRVDNIPIILAQFGGATPPDTSTTTLTVLLGFAQEERIENTGVIATSPIASLSFVDGYQDIRAVSGVNTDLPIYLTQATDFISYVSCDKFHRGTACIKDPRGNTYMFVVDNTELSIQDQTAFGAKAAFLWGCGNAGWGKDGAAIVDATIDWATNTGTFDYPTTGEQFALSLPTDLTRLDEYKDSEIDWTEQVPINTSVSAETSIDSRHVTYTGITKGGEIAGLTLNDDVVGTDFVLRIELDTTVTSSTPQVNQTFTVLEGNAPAMRQLGAGSAADPSSLAEDGWYDGGLVTWLTGENEGISMEVRQWTETTPARTIKLFLPMPFTIQDGDRFTVYVGCKKTPKTTGSCVLKFDNYVNYGGEPDVPGKDQLYRTPDSPV